MAMAMEMALPIVADIMSKLVDVAIRQARYSFQFDKYVNNLEKEKVNLQLKIEIVLGRAQEAKKKTEKTVSVVDGWLSKADSLMAEVLEMEETTKKRNKASCLKCCPNWFRRYGLAKKLEEKINEIIEHNKKEFPEFSRLATLVGMNYFSSEAFVHFNSRKVAYDGLLEALKDDKVHMIGLYGMGGCGKTTLVKEVGKEAEQFFDKVVFVTVSNTIHVRNIQGKIASQLDDLKLKEEDEKEERARRLFMRLNGGERLLIILDDVWRKLDFEAIGIPIGENKNGCTILITTRYRHVCTLMNCRSIVALDVLNMEEALTLFQKHAKLFDDNSETLKFKGLAEEITKECGGLPVAIAAVASTLKGKTQVEWVEALETLRDSSPMDIEEGLKNPYTCLRLSYDNLRNEVAKSLFLFCSVFPEDYEILIDDLTIFGVALGLIGEVHSYKRARNQVSISINKLVDSCLLLGFKENGYISMHDMVRDVALWIARKENKLIMGPERSQKALKEDMILKDNTLRYLWIEDGDKFPHKLLCPKLEFFYVSTESKHHVDLTNDFFNGIKKLRVLFLENYYSDEYPVLQLPKSILLTNNLHHLSLGGWLLGDISLLDSLKRLVFLKLSYCCIDEIPNSITQRNLRLVDISFCVIKKNPYEVIGRCSSHLEELYFYGNKGGDWEDKGENAADFFDKFSATPTLERYRIDLGKSDEDRQMYDSLAITRGLFVGYFETCISNAVIKDLMQKAQALSLAGIKSCKNIIPNVVQRIGGGMNDLISLSLNDSDEIEYVIDIANHHLNLVGFISNLTHLKIKGMKHLKTLCHGHPPQGLFASLELLLISNCNSLEHIITDEVKEIAVEDNEYQRSNSLAFPKLKKLIIKECNQLEYLLPVSFAHGFPQLERLEIGRATNLKTVFGQSSYEDQNPNKFQIMDFSALKELFLSELPNVISICPKNYYPRWPSLESLYLEECSHLTTISTIIHGIPNSGLRQDHIVTEDVMEAKEIHLEKLKTIELRNFNRDIIFYLEGQQMNSALQSLILDDLPELRHIWVGPKYLLQLQNIVRLDIRKCGILKVVFPTTISRSLTQLRELIIIDCKELEEIIEEEEEEDDDEENQNVSNPQLLFPNLTTIIIRHCQKLKRVFPVSTSRVLPNLKVLWIEEASQLEQVFGNEQEETVENIEVVMIPVLKYVILMNMPKLKMGPQWIELQTVRCLFVQDSQNLTLTSTVATLEELDKICEDEIDEVFDEDIVTFLDQLEDIIEDDEELSEIEDISSHVKTEQNNSGMQLEQKLTPIASPNLNESQNKTTKKTVGEVSALEIPIAMATSSTNPEFELANDEVLLGTKIVNKLEDQSTKEQNISEEMRVERSFKEGSKSENTETVISLIHSEPAQSLPSPSVISLPRAFPLSKVNIKQIEIDSGKDIQANPIINLQDFEDDGGQSLNEAIPGLEILAAIETSYETELVNKRSASEPSLTDQQPLGESEITNKEMPQGTKSDKEVEDEDQSVKEGNISEETNTVKINIEKGSTSENARAFPSLPKEFPHRQIKCNQTEREIDEDTECNLSINFLDSEDDGGQLPKPFVPTVATTKEELVTKALSDLEASLKMPLKDIATSKANSHRLLTALNFLSRLSLDVGALPHGLKAIIDSLHKDLPSILCSFAPNLAKINNFPKLMDEAQEKEARLEKEIEDCEAKLSSLEEQKKKCVAKTIEFKKEFESVRKEKSEMVEDQRKAEQEIFQNDYRWSILCSQFQLNSIDDRNLS